MKLEDYFDFLTPNDIRVKGTRVGLETILLDYLELGPNPRNPCTDDKDFSARKALSVWDRFRVRLFGSGFAGLGLFPEDIAMRYPTLSLEAVYATITYYWHNQERMDTYLQEWREHSERMRREQERHPPLAVQRLRTMIHQRQLESA